MAWTTPPTFADTPSAAPTAADFNALVNDVIELSAASAEVNPPFASVYTQDGDVGENDANWFIRHTHRYLHWSATIITGSTADFHVYFNGVAVYTDATNRATNYVYEGYVDLNDTGVIATTPTIGDWYKIHLDIEEDSASLALLVAYIVESPETSL